MFSVFNEVKKGIYKKSVIQETQIQLKNQEKSGFHIEGPLEIKGNFSF